MRSKLAPLAVWCMLSTAMAEVPWGGESQRPRAQAYAIEGLGALGGTCVCLGVAVFAAFNATSWLEGGEYGIADVVLPVSVAVLPASAAYGAVKVGEGLGEDGSPTLAFVGAYACLPLAVGAIALGAYISSEDQHSRGPSYWGIPFYVLGGLAVPVGAVVGYNLGARRVAGPYQFGFGSRLQAPAVALTCVGLPDHSVEYGVKAQLAGFRF